MDANQARKLLYTRSFLLCMLTINAIPTPTISKYCCSAAGECTSLNATKFHLYDENPQAIKDWTQLTYQGRPDDLCPTGNNAINSKSPAMSELVVMASPRCRGYEPKHYVTVLGDHKTNLFYRIDINPGSNESVGYYREQFLYCMNTATIIDRQKLPRDPEASFTVLVTTKVTTTEQNIRDSDADVFVRVIPEGDGVIYTTYNTTNGTVYCSQKYIPLLADDIESEINQGVGGLTVWWGGQDHSDGTYIVVVGDSCIGKDPGPCFIVQNTTKVTINFNLSSILGKKIRIYNIITINCVNPEIGHELVHLFKGCSDACCTNSNYYHDPMSVKSATEPSSSSATATHVTIDCHSDKTEENITIHKLTTESSVSAATVTPAITDCTTCSTTKDSISPTTQLVQTSYPTVHEHTSVLSTNAATVVAPIATQQLSHPDFHSVLPPTTTVRPLIMETTASQHNNNNIIIITISLTVMLIVIPIVTLLFLAFCICRYRHKYIYPKQVSSKNVKEQQEYEHKADSFHNNIPQLQTPPPYNLESSFVNEALEYPPITRDSSSSVQYSRPQTPLSNSKICCSEVLQNSSECSVNTKGPPSNSSTFVPRTLQFNSELCFSVNNDVDPSVVQNSLAMCTTKDFPSDSSSVHYNEPQTPQLDSEVYCSEVVQNSSVCSAAIHDSPSNSSMIVSHILPFDSELCCSINEEAVQNSLASTKCSPSRDSQSQEQSPTALVVYSPNTIEREHQLIHSNLMAELKLYGIKILSHDLTSIQGSISAWLEREAKRANVVLCVCNKEFKDEWECQSEASLPLVRSLRHLIHGTVQTHGESLSKYAVVLLEPSHRQYIPTKYLQSDSRQFTLTDTTAIAQYMLNIPPYALPKQSIATTPD